MYNAARGRAAIAALLAIYDHDERMSGIVEGHRIVLRLEPHFNYIIHRNGDHDWIGLGTLVAVDEIGHVRRATEAELLERGCAALAALYDNEENDHD